MAKDICINPLEKLMKLFITHFTCWTADPEQKLQCLKVQSICSKYTQTCTWVSLCMIWSIPSWREHEILSSSQFPCQCPLSSLTENVWYETSFCLEIFIPSKIPCRKNREIVLQDRQLFYPPCIWRTTNSMSGNLWKLHWISITLRRTCNRKPLGWRA